MHPAARDYCAQFGNDDVIDAVEIGARNINGDVRDIWPNARWYGIDMIGGRGVDEIADGATWQPAKRVRLVVCTEVLEHAPQWREIVQNAYHMLTKGGRFIVTCAGPGREVHGVDEGWTPVPGYYENVSHADLHVAMIAAGFGAVTTEHDAEDTRSTGVKRSLM